MDHYIYFYRVEENGSQHYTHREPCTCSIGENHWTDRVHYTNRNEH